ncbi:MAG: TetR/AcrR family transcriptional regulator [Bacteroidetes bacterium]|nr:TetR/AcrR family transcriptional regulator [Bacteroidota bacterium]
MQDNESFLSFVAEFMEIKDKILQGAEDLFFKYGIKNITMDEVARHLGMSKKTLYQYFKDKDELVHSLIIEKIEEDKIIFGKTHRDSENIVVEAFEIMKNIREIMGHVNPVLFYELAKFYPKTWNVFNEFKNGFIRENLEESIKRGQELGLVRKDLNVKVASRMRLENIDMSFNQEVFSTDKFNLVDIHVTMTELFLYGICTLKGHKLINKYKNVTEE